MLKFQICHIIIIIFFFFTCITIEQLFINNVSLPYHPKTVVLIVKPYVTELSC